MIGGGAVGLAGIGVKGGDNSTGDGAGGGGNGDGSAGTAGTASSGSDGGDSNAGSGHGIGDTRSGIGAATVGGGGKASTLGGGNGSTGTDCDSAIGSGFRCTAEPVTGSVRDSGANVSLLCDPIWFINSEPPPIE